MLRQNLLASALVSAAGAAAAVLAHQDPGRKVAPIPAQPSTRDAVPIIRVGNPKSVSDTLGETSSLRETNHPQSVSGAEAACSEPQVAYPPEGLTQAA